MTKSNYQGQPTYVVLGYLKDLYEPWAYLTPTDERGEFVVHLWECLSSAVSNSDEKRALVLVEWLREDLDIADAEHWWRVTPDNEADLDDLYEAQDAFVEITSYWRERAVSFKGEAALEETIKKLPAWVRPDPNRPAAPDYERREYERLKAKFEQRSEQA